MSATTIETSAQKAHLRVIANSSTQVVNLNDHRNTDLIESLESMLKCARRGDLKGLIYIARMRSSEQHAGAVGNYMEDPTPGLIKAVECLAFAQSRRERK